MDGTLNLSKGRPLATDDLILAVDIGTSATKAVLFDTDSKQVAIARKHYPILTPHKGWSEQEPAVVFSGMLAAMREITASLPEGCRILGVTFSSQLYSLLAVDAEGNALTNSLTWSDTRSAQIAKTLNQDREAQGIFQRTGCPIDAIYPLSKLLWIQGNVDLPEYTRFVSIKEYLMFRLTGRWLADWSVASATGLFDIGKYRWDETALSLLKICPDNLSELVPPKHTFTEWNPEIIELLRLPLDTPLIIGGGDGPLASVGVGAFNSNSLAVNVGTSAAARSIIPEAKVDPAGRLWTYVVDENLWVIGGIVSSGGIVYDWALKNFFSGIDEIGADGFVGRVQDYAESLAMAVPPGAENLLFVPYLGGEQCPDWQPDTRGSFFGLDFKHRQGHLVRSVLEGITRSIYRVSESIQPVLNSQFSEIRVTGGLTSSPLWLQIAADMFGVPIAASKSAEGSARGAAMLALISLGVKSDVEAFADPVSTRQRVYPREKVHAYYQKQYQEFQKLLDYARGFQKN
jgi:gluconokinase